MLLKSGFTMVHFFGKEQDQEKTNPKLVPGRTRLLVTIPMVIDRQQVLLPCTARTVAAVPGGIRRQILSWVPRSLPITT